VIGALSFLTIAGRSRPPTPADLIWFPAVGASLGAVLGLLWWGAGEVWPASVSAALVVVADLALTGLLHVDGLADSADGLLPHLDRERRLAVMSAPDVGAFGIATVAAALLVRWAAIGALPVTGWRGVLLMAGIWATARAAMVLTLASQHYARAEGGLASVFTRVPPGATVAAAGSGIAALAVVLPRPWAPAGILAGLGAGALVVALARRRIGGYTGDVLGALGIAVETVALVTVAAA
jgi:adenosylcobinamide-GDP ribazoletransferase